MFSSGPGLFVEGRCGSRHRDRDRARGGGGCLEGGRGVAVLRGGGHPAKSDTAHTALGFWAPSLIHSTTSRVKYNARRTKNARPVSFLSPCPTRACVVQHPVQTFHRGEEEGMHT